MARRRGPTATPAATSKTWFPALRGMFSGYTTGGGSLDSRIVSGPRAYVVPGQPYTVDWDTDRAVREGYAYNPYVFRCVEFIASNERARRIVLRKEDSREGPILKPGELDKDQQVLLRRLNRRANAWEVAKIFRHRLIAQYLLSSRGVFIEAVRSRRGSIHSIYLLDPDRVLPVPGRRKRNPDDPTEVGVITPIESFRVTTAAANGAPFFDFRPPFDPQASPDDQPSGIVWIRSPHPTMFERGMSPMEAAGLSTDLDRYARLYNRRFMQQDGRPGGVLAVKGPIEDQFIDQLERRFNSPENTAQTLAIEADDMTWTDTSGTPRDMMWGDTMDRTKREICVAFGLPESVISDSSGETFDNADADYAKAWEHGLLPLFDMLDAQLDVLTPGGYDDDTYLSHDVSDVWVLGRYQRAREDRAVADFNNGIITIDEVREVKDLDPWDVPASRVLWIPAGRLAVGDDKPAHDGDAEAAGRAPLGGQPATLSAGGGGELPPGFGTGFDPTADLMGGPVDPSSAMDGGGGTGGDQMGSADAGDEGAGPPNQRALAQADRTGGATLTAAPQMKALEGEQRGARFAYRR